MLIEKNRAEIFVNSSTTSAHIKSVWTIHVENILIDYLKKFKERKI